MTSQMSQTVLALDLGTSRVKALLLAEDGTIQAKTEATYPVTTGPGGQVEQDPDDWSRAVVTAIRKLAKQAVKYWPPVLCSVTGQMHGLVLLGKSGQPARPAIICSDFRAQQEAQSIASRLSPERILQLTGNPALGIFPGPKVLWIQRHEPSIYRSVKKLLLPKDYVGFVMTGEIVTDHSDASGTMLYNIHSKAWDRELCEACEVPNDWLPLIISARELRGRVTKSFADQSGLRAGTPVLVGAGDLSTTVIGTGITGSGQVGVSLGTAGIVFRITDGLREETLGRVFNFRHALPLSLISMGSCPAAGFSIKWFENAILGGKALTADSDTERRGEQLLEKHSLYFLPFLLGAGSPSMDYKQRGAFIGLTHYHTGRDLRRAIMEGVALSLRSSYELLIRGSDDVQEIRVCGGGSYDKEWVAILAGVLGRPVLTLEEPDAAVLGAAVLAGVAASWWESIEEAVHTCVRVREAVEPPLGATEIFSRAFRKYCRLCELLDILQREGFWES